MKKVQADDSAIENDESGQEGEQNLTNEIHPSSEKPVSQLKGKLISILKGDNNGKGDD